MTDFIPDPKRALRKRIRALRDSAPPEARAAWSATITARALAHPAYHAARTIFIFLAFQSEVDTSAIIQHALARSKCVCVPDFPTPGAPMALTKIDTLDAAAYDFGLWGTRAPKLRRPAPIDSVDLVFAPLLVFARTPNGVARLGYGKGYYDAFLPRLRPGVPVIGLAFELQCVPALPLEAHEVFLDALITEESG
jgi:5-formyltetrahydrofolate cyclo-ligase